MYQFVQAAFAFKYEHDYPICNFTSHQPRMILKGPRNMIAYLQFCHIQTDLNQQQIDSHYSCTLNLTGNTVK